MKLAGAAALVAASLWTGAASAKVYTFDFTGTIASQTNPGSDPNIAVGDILRIEARVSDARVIDWGNYGYKVAAFYGLPTEGEEYFRITLNGLTWFSLNEYRDGAEIFDDYYAEYLPDGSCICSFKEGELPAIAFKGNNVLGATGVLYSTGGEAQQKPVIDLGSNISYGARDVQIDPEGLYGGSYEFLDFYPVISSPTFTIEETQDYGNSYKTPGFTGTWNYRGGVAVPEPSTWALMIFGFGAAGAALRRHSKTKAVAQA